MNFLSPASWKSWCEQRGILCEGSGHPRPQLDEERFHLVELPYPEDSGRKVHFAKKLVSLVTGDGDALLLIDEWGVWPSSQHLPLLARFREAFGERRSLQEVPAHLISPNEADDGASIIAMSLFFIWDCYGISDSGRNAFFVSHDEYCVIASQDQLVAKRFAAAMMPRE